MQIKFGNLTVEITYNKNTMPEIDPTKISPEVSQKYQLTANTFIGVAKDNPKDKIDIEIGDSKQPDFKPQVKIMRWDNETNLSFRLKDDGLEKETVTTDKDKIVWSKGTREVHFYEFTNAEHPEGASEFEIILKEKPKTNVVEFTLVDKDVAYHYQPAISPEEIERGANRPENVEGSYAVYAKTPKTNWADGKEYRVGKIGHIYRPKITDSVGTEVWGDLHVENGTLSVTIPQDFLDGAVYPVRHAAGLTFGYTTQGASAQNGQVVLGNAFTMPANGTVTNITMYVSYNYYGGAHRAAIYNSTSLTNVGTSIVKADCAVDTNTGWIDNAVADTSLTGGVNYFLLFSAPQYSNRWTGAYDVFSPVQSNDITTSTNYATGTSSTIKRAQKFQASSGYDLISATIKAAKVSSPTDNVYLELYSDSSGTPGSLLATSDVKAASSLSTSATFYNFTFSSPYSLASGTYYWLVFTRSGAADATNYFLWSGHSSTVYQVVKIYNGTDWNGVTGAKGQYFLNYDDAGILKYRSTSYSTCSDSDEMDSPLTSENGTANRNSIYATYTAGGGGSAPSIESDLIIYN